MGKHYTQAEEVYYKCSHLKSEQRVLGQWEAAENSCRSIVCLSVCLSTNDLPVCLLSCLSSSLSVLPFLWWRFSSLLLFPSSLCLESVKKWNYHNQAHTEVHTYSDIPLISRQQTAAWEVKFLISWHHARSWKCPCTYNCFRCYMLIKTTAMTWKWGNTLPFRAYVLHNLHVATSCCLSWRIPIKTAAVIHVRLYSKYR